MTRRVEETDHYLAMSERDLKELVLRAARAMGWIVYHVPNEPARNSGVGYPDLTLARDGEVLWMELKAKAGVLSREQGVWLEALPHAHIIRPIDWYSGRVAELLS
jgi:predicted type IV restriction endonuclease